MQINLTKRQIEFILDAMWLYEIVGYQETKAHVSTKQYDTANSIVEKLKDLYE